MSRLPKAPLVEVIFEIKWPINTVSEIEKYQYFVGDFYNKVKDEFNFRKPLVPIEVPIELYINTVAHQFKPSENDYPIIQVGPGIVTVNTIDPKYDWDEFKGTINNTLGKLIEVYPFNIDSKSSLSLQYYDFFEFNFDNDNIFEFLKENLHINISQSFYEPKDNPFGLTTGFYYHTEIGSLSINLNKGKNKEGIEGIVIQTKISRSEIKPAIEAIDEWANKAYSLCSHLFKQMTKGKLYDSFKD